MATKELKKDIEDLKDAVNMVSQDISRMTNQMSTIMSFMKEMSEIKKKSEEQENKIKSLENRILDLEQAARLNDVVVTGLKIKPRSYAKAVEVDDQQDKDRHDESTEAQVTAFLQEKNITIERNDIEACHTIPVNTKNGKVANHVIIIKFVNRKKKVDLLKQGKKLKGTNVYLNEHLIKRNADIAKRARFLKKQGKLQSTWVHNCKVFVKLNGNPEQAKVLCIRSLEELNEF